MLSLGYNGLTEKGATMLAAALGAASLRVKRLNLRGNKIGRDGAVALVEAVVGPTMGWGSTSGADDDDAEKKSSEGNPALVGSIAAAAALVLAFGTYKVYGHVRAQREAEAAARHKRGGRRQQPRLRPHQPS